MTFVFLDYFTVVTFMGHIKLGTLINADQRIVFDLARNNVAISTTEVKLGEKIMVKLEYFILKKEIPHFY